MAIEIIQRRKRVESVTHSLIFESKDMPGAGWAPPCDADGNLLGNEHASKEQREAEMAAIIAAGEHHAPRIETYRSSYVEPAVGRCTCGCEVTLSDPLNNECERCHRWYNMMGQEKIDPNGELARELDAEGSW